MKRFILLVMMLLPVVVMAKHPEFDKLSQRYADVEGVTVMNIDKAMLKLMAPQEMDSEAMEHLDNILILIAENDKLSNDILKRSAKIIKKLKLESYVSVDEEGAKVDIYCTKSGETLTDLVIKLKDDATGGVIVISGEVPGEMINNIIQTM